jgi:hypothetical protein
MVITEKQFQAWVTKLAKFYGYLVYHTWNSFRSTEGFPDCVMVRPGRLLFAELKSDKGKVTPAQQTWLETLKAAGCEAHLWRPADSDEIERILK